MPGWDNPLTPLCSGLSSRGLCSPDQPGCTSKSCSCPHEKRAMGNFSFLTSQTSHSLPEAVMSSPRGSHLDLISTLSGPKFLTLGFSPRTPSPQAWTFPCPPWSSSCPSPCNCAPCPGASSAPPAAPVLAPAEQRSREERSLSLSESKICQNPGRRERCVGEGA